MPRVNKTISYTENFYKAVNKEWLSSHEPKPETGQISGMSIMHENTELQVKKILDRLDKAKNLLWMSKKL